MKIIHETPTLQSVAKTGKKKFWRGEVLTDGDSYYYQKVWWQEGSKVQTSTPVRVKGKNVGKSNETTDKEQALSEIASIENKQRDKGYSEDGTVDHIPTKPMLAHKYETKKHKVSFPCFVQPKLDGFRMISDGKKGYTRGGKEHVQECVQHLMFDTMGYQIDGELILPGNRPLQETAKAAKKFREDVSPTLRYMVYDVVIDEPYEKRLEILNKIMENAPPNVLRVQTNTAKTEEEVFYFHHRFISSGFEGTMVRNNGGGYLVGHRSNDLLKLKDFQDAEFEIVDVEEGKGSFRGKAIFVCKTDDGNIFNVTPEGTSEHREELWRTREDHVGKMLTVRYQALTNDGIPQFPIGVSVREEWDT